MLINELPYNISDSNDDPIYKGTDINNNVAEICFNFPAMNNAIAAYNEENQTNFPQWDNLENNFEKSIHFIFIYLKVLNLKMGNDSLNIKYISTRNTETTMGNRGVLTGKSFQFFLPFTSDVDGDPDDLG